MSTTVWAIVGPTGVGKTAAGIALARRMGAEIVSADSRQVYRYMDIGTAKPSPEEQRAVRHHLIDVVDPDEPFSAGEYGRRARRVIKELDAAGIVSLIAGGAGLYLRALTGGLFREPSIPATVRQRLRERVSVMGPEALHRELGAVDPETAARLHPRDRQRIVRALEVYEATGVSLSAWQRTASDEAVRLRIRMIGLHRDRAELYRMIDARVDRMMEMGLVDEVRRLLERGYSPDLSALRTFGYAEIIAHLHGNLPLDRATTLIKQQTRRYAKRQMTWFRHIDGIQWIDASGQFDGKRVCEAILTRMQGWSEDTQEYSEKNS